MNIRLVSGYVPIRVNHRSPAEYRELGAKLEALPVPKSIYLHGLQYCWMFGALADKTYRPRTSGNPGKNTTAYHIVQHQKTTWLLRAATEHLDADVLVWMDYGIFHMENVTEKAVLDFLLDCQNEKAISIPGSWPKGQDGGPCWRFNGSILVCHRDYIERLDHAVRAAAMEHVEKTKTVIWEVNAWATVEAQNKLPIRWYGAAHDGTMLTEYRKNQ